MIYKVYNKKYLLGDIHGSWSIIARHIAHNDEKNIAYIQVGDFGIGFYGIDEEHNRLKQLNSILNDNESDLYVMRGNHDDPAWFKDDGNNKISDIKLGLNRIVFVSDYTVINIDGENILFVGGAISIDRIPRRKDDSWFVDEEFFLDREKLQSLEGIDRVVTHTCPDFCEPRSFGPLVYEYASKDKSLIKELKDEREILTEMANILMLNGKNKTKGWYYGHFHRNHRFLHNNMEFVCLGIDEFMQL